MTRRLLLVSSAREHAGAERYLEVLVAHLERGTGDGWEVHCALPAGAVVTARRLAALDVVLHAVPGLGRRPTASGVRGLRRAVRGAKPDVVHLNLSDQGDGLTAVLATAGLCPALVATVHNAVPGRRPGLELLSAAVLRRCDALVVPSQPVADGLPLTRRTPHVIPNGLAPTALADSPRAALGLPEDALVVGGIGRLHEQKAWHVLASAALAVRERHPRARVVVVGEGPLRGALSLLPGLELLGPHPDAAALVGAFDVLAVPSRYEAFGYVALEAMQAGVPVVASDVGGLPGLIGDAGVLVPPGDPAALAGALSDLLADPTRRAELGRRGRERARLFTPEATAAATQAVYRSVLDRR